MEGITILQTFENTSSTWGWSWFGAILAILAIINIIIVCIADDFAGLSLIAAILCGCIAVMLFSSATEIPAPNTYQVLIDDSVSFKDFTEKYEVLEIQGKTYLVQEREDEQKGE